MRDLSAEMLNLCTPKQLRDRRWSDVVPESHRVPDFLDLPREVGADESGAPPTLIVRRPCRHTHVEPIRRHMDLTLPSTKPPGLRRLGSGSRPSSARRRVRFAGMSLSSELPADLREVNIGSTELVHLCESTGSTYGTKWTHARGAFSTEIHCRRSEAGEVELSTDMHCRRSGEDEVEEALESPAAPRESADRTAQLHRVFTSKTQAFVPRPLVRASEDTGSSSAEHEVADNAESGVVLFLPTVDGVVELGSRAPLRLSLAPHHAASPSRAHSHLSTRRELLTPADS